MIRHHLPCPACKPGVPCRQFRMAEADERHEQSVAEGLDRIRWENFQTPRPERVGVVSGEFVWCIGNQRWERMA